MGYVGRAMWDNITILQVTHTNDGEYEPEDEADDCDVADGGEGSHQRANNHLHACEYLCYYPHYLSTAG